MNDLLRWRWQFLLTEAIFVPAVIAFIWWLRS